MAGRSALPSSLFPFMSVLACTIGALVVLLAIISLSAVGVSGAAARASDETQRAIERDRAKARALERRLAEAEAAWAAVDSALEERGWERGLDAFSIARKIRRAASVASAASEIDELEARARALEAERGEVETSIEVLASRRETLPILIDPTGLSPHLTPYFIECFDQGVTVFRVSDDLRFSIPRDELAMTGDLARYLRRLVVEPGALLVLLVRPDGLPSARSLRRLARDAGIRVARLPLPGQGELDLRLLRRAEGEG